MGLFDTLVDEIREVDVIIAGGGSAGCIVATRLTEADPSLSILLIEGGTDNYDVPSVIYPALFVQNLVPSTGTAIHWKSKATQEVANRNIVIQSGGILGGGSSINFMAYVRGQRCDFDSWKTPGWTVDELLPYFKKLRHIETYHGRGDLSTHGHDGPIQVSDGSFRCQTSSDDFMEATKALGYDELQDAQSFDSGMGFERWSHYISPQGRRQDTAHTYLHPKLQDGRHPNLHVLVESKVLRVLFDHSHRACGVEVTPNPGQQTSIPMTEHPNYVVKARKLVVVSSGVLGSPLILERSEIGNPEVLKRAGVPVLVDLPGVGRNYQDHNLIYCPYKTSLKPGETLDALWSGRYAQEDAINKHDPILGWNACDIFGHIRPTDSEVAQLGPEFKVAWDKDFKDHHYKPLTLMGPVSGYLGDHKTVKDGQYITVVPYTAYPWSRGSVHITGPSLQDEVDFDCGFLTNPNDVTALMFGYKKARELTRRTKLYRGEVASGHPKFPRGSKAACVDLRNEAPTGENITDLEYSKEDDKALEQWIREGVGSTWHSMSTNRMAKRDEFGVVDSNLNVYGVQGLKVIDLSIAPENVGANTHNTALVIGEKGASILIEELGLS